MAGGRVVAGGRVSVPSATGGAGAVVAAGLMQPDALRSALQIRKRAALLMGCILREFFFLGDYHFPSHAGTSRGSTAPVAGLQVFSSCHKIPGSADPFPRPSEGMTAGISPAVRCLGIPNPGYVHPHERREAVCCLCGFARLNGKFEPDLPVLPACIGVGRETNPQKNRCKAPVHCQYF